jgi:hypothetical protein
MSLVECGAQIGQQGLQHFLRSLLAMETNYLVAHLVGFTCLFAPYGETGDEDKSFRYTCRSALPDITGITWSGGVGTLKAKELEGVYGTARDRSTNRR